MISAQTPTTLVQRARELFFEQQRDPARWIAPHIARSWQRSRPLEQSDAEPLATTLLRERREQSLRLLECAQPELDGLAEHAIGNGCVVILSDPSGLILDEIGSPEFLPEAQRVALTPGVEWSEQRRGTNAIGTALAEREALMVLGGEHYLAQNGALGCAAAPVFTSRGELAGALDISGTASCVNPHALGLVRLAAERLEHRMMLRDGGARVLRFHSRPSLLYSAREALLHLDGDRVIGANRTALALLRASWSEVLDRPVEQLLGPGWSSPAPRRGLITLPGGRQVAAIADEAPSRTHAPGRAAEPAPPVGADATAGALRDAVRVLDAGVALLVSGETGSGKEVFARRLHAASRRAAGPFVAVNCAALPESLIEAELFGYAEGAYTGARRRGMPGRIREAQGGVLFLDEIADMPLALQPRLLRVLEAREVTPLGGGATVKVDFDLVCATHGQLDALVSTGRFRADLLYRVAGFRVDLPALRDRPDRRTLIASLFDECGGAARGLRLSHDAMEQLAACPWPGNVRELRSTLQAIVALAAAGDNTITAELLPAHLRATGQARATPQQAVAAIDESASAAARRLGVHRSTVYRRRARAEVTPDSPDR